MKKPKEEEKSCHRKCKASLKTQQILSATRGKEKRKIENYESRRGENEEIEGRQN